MKNIFFIALLVTIVLCFSHVNMKKTGLLRNSGNEDFAQKELKRMPLDAFSQKTIQDAFAQKKLRKDDNDDFNRFIRSQSRMSLG